MSQKIKLSLLAVLRLDLYDLHTVYVRVVPGRHVHAVQAGEVHPVRALGLPVHGPGVAGQHVPDGRPQLLPPSQPAQPADVKLLKLSLCATWEDDSQVIPRVSDPPGHCDTDPLTLTQWFTGSVPGITGLGAVIQGDVGLDVEDRGAVQDVHARQVDRVPGDPLKPDQAQPYVGGAMRRPDIMMYV